MPESLCINYITYSSGGLASLPDGKWSPLNISQYGPPGYVYVKERESGELFCREIPASFQKQTNKITSCFMFLTQLLLGFQDAMTTHITPCKAEDMAPLFRKGAVLGGD
ncbi:hypothetical protein AVEN_258430-1 [Araneus ventricosus]|uniref:Uncharacterized protein n=1 Tax=Araneus ventricosus TaxID=182803 RepID=A0A4Y2DIM7_ARAVE|nr:hypothetical protein AVEN_258430-1 [Araneus ventricosus]